jgi:hypothetical protein
MLKLNGNWFSGSIPGSDVRSPALSFWITAVDSGDNSARSNTKTVDVREGQPASQARSSVSSLPAHVVQAIKLKAKPSYPVEKLEVKSRNSGSAVKTYPDEIVIRNTGTIPVNNIRIMLSPQLARSFSISEPAIKSIEPNANVTIKFELNGNPNRNTAGGFTAYSGEILIVAEHHNPVTLKVDIGGLQADQITKYMSRVASMAELRYNKVSLLSSMLSNDAKTQQNYKITNSNGEEMQLISTPSDELVIRNVGERQLKNIRLYLSNVGHTFLLEHTNIQYLEPNGEISVKLIPRIEMNKYSKDINGELLIVPANDNPIQIPISIEGKKQKSSAGEFETHTLSGEDAIYSASESILVRNDGDRTMDSVKVILDNNLERIFSASTDSFTQIGPRPEIIFELKYNLKDLKTFMQNYEGTLSIISEHHESKSIPVKIVWREMFSEHFTVYFRNGDEVTAKNVLEFMENNYVKTERLGAMGNTVIYMTGSMEEMKLVNPSGRPFYSYADDVIVICECNEPQKDALKKFIYGLVINKYASYHNMKMLTFYQENWLLDGMASYMAMKLVDEPVEHGEGTFQWFGHGSDMQYAATQSFLNFLESRYGDDIIDRILHFLGSGMVSSSKCSALEECAVLRAVYDAEGYKNDKKYALSFKDIAEEWREYVEKRVAEDAAKDIGFGFSITIPKNMFAYHIN